ncbi:MAG TPA: hypothetical protein VMV94_04875 [Phycisphaerae bacterium]|nr:hypothetical protein [Phycisphaerae bacterium]
MNSTNSEPRNDDTPCSTAVVLSYAPAAGGKQSALWRIALWVLFLHECLLAFVLMMHWVVPLRAETRTTTKMVFTARAQLAQFWGKYDLLTFCLSLSGLMAVAGTWLVLRGQRSGRIVVVAYMGVAAAVFAFSFWADYVMAQGPAYQMRVDGVMIQGRLPPSPLVLGWTNCVAAFVSMLPLIVLLTVLIVEATAARKKQAH